MENKDIILIITVLIVLYLLYCVNNINKDKFTETSSATSITSSTSITSISKEIEDLIDNKVDRRLTIRDNTSITESIKNLGILAQSIQNENGYTFPSNLNVTGKFNLLPTGTIVMWGKNEIPDGWVECDGSNGTPDLRGRFIYGRKSGYPFNRKGGEMEHVLSVEEMPSHSHNLKGTTHNGYKGGYISVEGGTIPYATVPGGKSNGWGVLPAGGREVKDADGKPLKDKDGNLVYETVPHNNMPPYYVLTYIMKVYDE
jgi:hypothetical protein